MPAASALPVAAAGGDRPLGAWPLCEPSGALRLDDGAILVADNEGRPAEDGETARPTLWVVADGDPAPVTREEVEQDAEALVRLGDELWVVGSLSRDKSCEVRAKRWEIHVLAPPAWTAAGMGALAPRRVIERKKSEIATIEGTVDGCRRLLFGGLAEAEAVCAAVVAAAAMPAGAPCDALNVEGAFAVDGRVWLGLRAPLAGGRAVLARLEPSHATLAFDAVRFVDLGGLGVRELVVDDDRLYGVAGTVADATAGQRSTLFSVPLAGLASGSLPVVVHDADLPASAESFALGAGSVRYLLDGSVGPDGTTACERPARQLDRPR